AAPRRLGLAGAGCLLRGPRAPAGAAAGALPDRLRRSGELVRQLVRTDGLLLALGGQRLRDTLRDPLADAATPKPPVELFVRFALRHLSISPSWRRPLLSTRLSLSQPMAGYGRRGESRACKAQPFPSGSLKKTKRPHGKS